MFRLTKPSIIPQFIKINDFIKFQVKILSKSDITFYSLPIELSQKISSKENTIDVEEFIKLKIDQDSNFHNISENTVITNTTNLLNEAVSKLNINQQNHIKQEIFNLTTFDLTYYSKWNITNLVRKYNITSKDIFMCLVNNISPYEIGMLSYKDNIDLRKIYETREKLETKYVCFDWLNGCAIKNCFPININNDETPFILNMKQYNDRNNYTGYNKIINLIESKLNNPVKFEKYKHKLIDYKESNFLSLEEITKHNSKLSKDIIDNAVSDGQNWFNHRKATEFENKHLWTFMMQSSYDTFVKTKLGYCELLNWFNFYNNIQYDNKFDKEDMSIVNSLIYGKSYVLNINNLDRILPFVKMSASDYNLTPDTIQIDNYVITHTKFNTKTYIINWKDDNINKLKSVVTDYHKLMVVRAILQLMNEVDPKLLNLVNYYMLAEYERQFCLTIQMQPRINDNAKLFI